MTRVLIVDDELSARVRLRQLIERCEDLEIVGECDTAEAARAEIARLAPDIVFLDIQMPGGSPIEMLRAQTGGDFLGERTPQQTVTFEIGEISAAQQFRGRARPFR